MFLQELTFREQSSFTSMFAGYLTYKREELKFKKKLKIDRYYFKKFNYDEKFTLISR